MTRITIVTLSLQRGGAEGVIARLCNDALAGRYEVNIVTCMNREVQYELDDRIVIHVIDDADQKYSNLIERFVVRRKRLSRILKELKSDIVISFLPEPNFLVLSLKRRIHCPVVISVRNDPVREYSNRVYYSLMRYFYPKADGYVFQTEMARDYFGFDRRITEKAAVIPNALAKDYMNLELSKNRNGHIVHVGRLDSQKNQKMLIKAFAEFSGEAEEYTLDIYGAGRLDSELKAYAAELGLGDKVVFHGNVDGLKERIQDAELFVLTSDYEGIPNSLMEALAQGIPSISTDCPCGGPGYLIEDGINGRLINVGDVKALVQSMREILNNRELADTMSKNAIESVRRIYPDKINDMWTGYIEKILNKELVSGND